MDTKLTLKLNENVINRAKKYASDKHLSLSRLIENYLDLLTREKSEDFEISPFVQSILNEKIAATDFSDEDFREDYLDFLDKKYR